MLNMITTYHSAINTVSPDTNSSDTEQDALDVINETPGWDRYYGRKFT